MLICVFQYEDYDDDEEDGEVCEDSDSSQSRLNTSLLAQEVLRDMATMVRLRKNSSGTPEPSSEKSSTSSTDTDKPGQKPKEESQGKSSPKHMKTEQEDAEDDDEMKSMSKVGYSGPTDVCTDESGQVLSLSPNSVRAKKTQANECPTENNVKVKKNNNNIEKSTDHNPAENTHSNNEEAQNVRKPRKGTPFKLCATPPSQSCIDLSERSRSAVSPGIGGYNSGSNSQNSSRRSSQENMPNYGNCRSPDSDDISQTDIHGLDTKPAAVIGNIQVPIKRQRKDTGSPRGYLKRHSMQYTEPVAPSIASDSAQSAGSPLDLTHSAVRAPTNTASAVNSTPKSTANQQSSADGKQILLLNGLEYEIVPLGNGRWISKNEYELIRQLNSVHPSSPVSNVENLSKVSQKTANPVASLENDHESALQSKKEEKNAASHAGGVNHETVTKILANKLAEKSSCEKPSSAASESDVVNSAQSCGIKRCAEDDLSKSAKRQKNDNSLNNQPEKDADGQNTIQNGFKSNSDSTEGCAPQKESKDGVQHLDSNENGINTEDEAVVIEGKKHFPLLKQLLKPPLVQ